MRTDSCARYLRIENRTMEYTNGTMSALIDDSINRTMDIINTIIRQILQLILCLVSIIVIGKFVSILIAKKDKNPLKSEVQTEANENHDEPKVVEKIDNMPKMSDWDSEIIDDESPVMIPKPHIMSQVHRNSLQQIKLPRRKCMSVGPVMLTPHAQIVRTIHVEDREERYCYDIKPIDATENVCVQCCHFL